MRVLHLEYDKYPDLALSELTKVATVVPVRCETQEDLYRELSNNQYGVIFTRLGLLLDAKCMSLQKGLRFIVSPTTGLNHIDAKYATEKGIQIISLKGEAQFLASIKSTAEHTWGLLLSLTRNIKASTNDVLNGNWTRKHFLCDELNGSKLGIIGYGRLGKIVAGYGKAFGMEVLITDIDASKYESITEDVKPTALEDLLAQSDYVLLMISWSEENELFADFDFFEKMKSGAYFVNTSRGELVDEKALLHVLENNHLAGAALDVLAGDSVWDGKVSGAEDLVSYAKNHTNLLITPHIGGYGRASIARTREFIVHKLLSEFKDETHFNSRMLPES